MNVYRFYNTQTSAHFFTSSLSERTTIFETLPNFNYEGIAWTVDETDLSASDNYRFYNNNSGAHFYTASASEAQSVRDNLSNFTYEEGAGFPVSRSSLGLQSHPVYRFYRYDTDSHFYTASSAERDHIINELPTHYAYEGIGWYTAAEATPAEQAADQEDIEQIYAFDENWYLTAYPDVAAAVAAGLTTAEAHFQNFGILEGRLGTDRASLQGDDSITESNSLVSEEIANGGSGDDYINVETIRTFGETGNDTLRGSGELVGGPGDDVYFGQNVTETADGGFDMVHLGGSEYSPFPVIYLSRFENIEAFHLRGDSVFFGTSQATVIGTDAPETFIHDHNDGFTAVFSTLDLAGGDDTLYAGGPSTVTLGDGVDHIIFGDREQIFPGIGVVQDSITLTDFDPDAGERIEVVALEGETFSSVIVDRIDGLDSIQITSSIGNEFKAYFENFSADQITLDWLVFS